MPRPARPGSAPLQRVRIERLVAGGDGLARADDGRVVFVPGALPGEVVEVSLVSSKRDFARARLRAVLEPAVERTEPPCAALARGCGGCDWQHADPKAQLAWKVEIVREALRRTARLDEAAVRSGGAVHPWGYRTSMRFSTDPSGRPSLRRARSHDDIPIDHCHVAHDALTTLLDHVAVPGADELSLRISASTGAATAWWEPETAQAARLPEGLTVGRDASLVEHVHGVAFRVSAPSFFQSGPAAAGLLVDAVRAAGGDLLASAAHVVDAYGGVGLFAATVVSPDARVTLVEGSAAACADARVNLTDRDAEVIADSVEHWAGAVGAVGAAGRIDVVVADPSRQGLGAVAAPALAALGAPLLLLVSCDPVALARDAVLLRESGYRHDGTTVLDLFPQTHHVEGVTRFVRFN